MAESLVVIRTFGSLLDADEAQIELLNAGIHSLVMSDDVMDLDGSARQAAEGIALAVHRRDAEVAISLLAPLADTG